MRARVLGAVLVCLVCVATLACGPAGEPSPSLSIFDPDKPCAGAEVSGLRVSTARGTTTGVVIDPGQPPAATSARRFTLAWPPGYSARSADDGTLEVVDNMGAVVAVDGTVLLGPQVCRNGEILAVTPTSSTNESPLP